MEKWQEHFTGLDAKLSELSAKAAKAATEVKAANTSKREEINEKIGDAKGNVAAFQENVRLQEKEDRAKLSSALLRAQMTIEAKIHDKRDARDKRLFDLYMKEQTAYIDDCFSAANYLIDNATLAILEMMDATDNYEFQHSKKEP